MLIVLAHCNCSLYLLQAHDPGPIVDPPEWLHQQVAQLELQAETGNGGCRPEPGPDMGEGGASGSAAGPV